ncbi:phage head closure protein [Candidatus Symbiopectobacterium sp. NZEC127]|uniref:phage head closure protein n=1 Tax=Candidatus Symbiopectobacterium sp. NZEC127 TaxID=2820472 RepID=UPI0022274851|nr:phage head closure protein [Candidatus Symbiopectobacterium sp. NZEC127]MCW2485941.1 phage head closure protein [Candidatus Symbiopectobacterium sp. NZEC127]
MRIGRLRHRVTIQNFTTTRDDSGQPIKTWFDAATAWAEVAPISGRELVASGAVSAEATIRVWMRYRSDVSAASRLLALNGPFKGLTLDIIGPPIPDGKCTRLEILCKQGVKRD